MLTLRPKTKPRETTNPLRAVMSVNVPHRKKIRPPKFAHNDFFRRTFDLCLYPNIVATIADLPEACRSLANIWREISNRDIYYERKIGNLPAYFGTRYMCVEFSEKDLSPSLLSDIAKEAHNVDYLPANFACYPYLRLRVDSLQVACFILSRWCFRTGQNPTNIAWYRTTRVRNKSRVVEDHERTQLCDPFRVEAIVSEYKPDFVNFGSCARLYCTPQPVQPEHVYNIPFVRSTQNIGEIVGKLRAKSEENCINKISGLLVEADNNFDNYVSNYQKWVHERYSKLVSNHKRRYFSRMGFWNAIKNVGSSRYSDARYRAIGSIAELDAMEFNDRLTRLVCPDILERYTQGLRFPLASELVAKHKELFDMCVKMLPKLYNKLPDIEDKAERVDVENTLLEQIERLETLIKRTRRNNKPPLLKELHKLKEKLTEESTLFT